LKIRLTTAAAALALVLVGVATADTTGDVLTLYPAGGGQDTYAAWKAQEGRPDSQGAANQALYLQNETSAPDTAAAAHVRGLENTPVRELVSLQYQHRVDSVCTKTDPRWTLFIQGKRRYVVTLGCAVTPARPTTDPRWIGRIFTQPVIRAEVLRQAGTDAFAGRIVGLAFVFDRSKGDVYADNLAVRSRTASKNWTYAGDNGNGVPGAPPSFSDEDRALLAAEIPAVALLDEGELMASLTPEEQAAIAEDADPAP
jgi:hypothetical protein